MNLIANTYLLLVYIIIFYTGATISAFLELLGNPEAIKLGRINLLESISKYLNYSDMSYIFGCFFTLIGILIFYLFTHNIFFIKNKVEN